MGSVQAAVCGVELAACKTEAGGLDIVQGGEEIDVYLRWNFDDREL